MGFRAPGLARNGSRAHRLSLRSAKHTFLGSRERRIMGMGRVQCRVGLPMPEFFAQFGSEGQCEAALEQARWPQGFRCPQRAAAVLCVLRVGSRKTFQGRVGPREEWVQASHCRIEEEWVQGRVGPGLSLSQRGGRDHLSLGPQHRRSPAIERLVGSPRR